MVGALSELAKDQTNRLALRKGNAIAPLISLLTGTNPALLVNVTRAVGQCAREPDNMVYVNGYRCRCTGWTGELDHF